MHSSYDLCRTHCTITWANIDYILHAGHHETNFSYISIAINTISLQNLYLNTSSPWLVCYCINSYESTAVFAQLISIFELALISVRYPLSCQCTVKHILSRCYILSKSFSVISLILYNCLTVGEVYLNNRDWVKPYDVIWRNQHRFR